MEVKKNVGSKKTLAKVKNIGCRSKTILMENLTPRSHRGNEISHEDKTKLKTRKAFKVKINYIKKFFFCCLMFLMRNEFARHGKSNPIAFFETITFRLKKYKR